MDRVYIKDSQVFYLNKFSSVEEENSEWITTYVKPINLERKMECSLIDISLPEKPYNYKILNKNLKIELIYDLTGLRDGGLENLDRNKYGNLNEDEVEYKDRFNSPKPFNEKDKPTKIINFNLKEEYNSYIELMNHILEVINIQMNERAKFEFKRWMPTSFDNNGNARNFVQFHPMKINQRNVEIAENLYYKFTAGRISAKETLPPGSTNEPEVRTIAFFNFSFNKELHTVLGIQDLFPLNTFSTTLNKIHETSTDDAINEREIRIKPYKNIFNNQILYVFCDILKDSFIGNQKGDVLRVFPFTPQKRNSSFGSKIFIPLRMDEIDTIKITIKDKNGELFYFQNDCISLTLLIRPIEMN